MSAKKTPNLLTRPLTQEEFNDLTRVRVDPFYFSTFIYVINALRGKIKFELYPYQKSVLWHFINNRFNIILKFRQAGLTELIAMFCLWYAQYHPNKNINIISIKDTVAKKVLRKIKFMYRNLPDHLKVPIVNGRLKDLGTTSEMEFANGSLISSIPTTEEAGRSESLSLLVIDEAAIVRWAEQIWAAAFPTLSTGGRAILNSTPYGMGGFFHKTWVNACSNTYTNQGSSFYPIRLRWQMHPLRGQGGQPCTVKGYEDHPDYKPWWYDEMSESLGPRRTAQEIDGDFLTSGFPVFDLIRIRAIEDMLSEYPPLPTQGDSYWRDVYRNLPGSLRDNLLIFNKPKKNIQYTLGADVSSGRSRDYSAFTLMDKLGEEHAVFKGKVPPGVLAEITMAIGKKFNYALIAPESNDIGLACTQKIQDSGYRNLYYSTTLVKKKREKKPKEKEIPGWYTTVQNRPVIIDELEEAIRLDEILVKDPFFVTESYTFIYNERNRPEALNKGKGNADGDSDLSDEDGFTDDSIIAKAITNKLRTIPRKGLTQLPI